MQVPSSPSASAALPGVADTAYFQQHWSVAFWRDFRLPSDMTSEEATVSTRHVPAQSHSTTFAAEGVHQGLKPFCDLHIVQS